MRRFLLIALMTLVGAGFAAAQKASPSTDVLGAHLNYGRGCAACHAPHSGVAGNGNTRTTAPGSGTVLLWGQDVSDLYGTTIRSDGGKFTEVLPTSLSASTPDVTGLLTCLGCHDGNFAPSAMMKNKLFESLPSTYGNANTIPTLIGQGSNGSFSNEHPVGLNAVVGCGGSSGWDCTETNGTLTMKGPLSSHFVTNYGFFVKLGVYNDKAVVVCTTCHDPHVMNVVTIEGNSTSGLPAGTYATMFFLRGPYNPDDPNPLTNQTAQFCRQCHADKSNERNGSTAGTVF